MNGSSAEMVGMISSFIERGFYSTAFQPIVETETGDKHGFEGLLRGPEDSPLANPGKLFNDIGFLPEHIRSGLDRACINSAVRTARNLPGRSRIFINVMGNTLFQLIDSIDEFVRLLAELDISADRIVFEISETTKKEFADYISGYLKNLRRLGISIALDDIGVRSPYLYHLLCMEPEYMKMDRMFIKDIDRDRKKQKLVACMVNMAECMGSRIIAEGIETKEEFETIRMIGVPYSQGYYLGLPRPAESWRAAAGSTKVKSVGTVFDVPDEAASFFGKKHLN